MKFTLVMILVVLSLALLSEAQSSPRPVSVGMRKAEQVDSQLENSMQPQRNGRSSTNPKMLQGEADELAQLAVSVPPGVQNVTKGVLEKDLVEKLKRIEKLSKRLRSELNN